MGQSVVPPGQLVAKIGEYEVGKTFQNHFHRKARIKYLCLCADGRQILFYEEEGGNVGQQLLNQDWIRQGTTT